MSSKGVTPATTRYEIDDGQCASVAVVEALATVGVEFETQAVPMAHHFDPEALDRLFGDAGGTPGGSVADVRVRLWGRTVRVTPDAVIVED